MASYARNIFTKNYRNSIIGVQVTVENVGGVFLTHSVYYVKPVHEADNCTQCWSRMRENLLYTKRSKCLNFKCWRIMHVHIKLNPTFELLNQKLTRLLFLRWRNVYINFCTLTFFFVFKSGTRTERTDRETNARKVKTCNAA